MNRRRFLTVFATAAAVAAVDPERLLWTPGARTHFLPPEGGWDHGVPITLIEPYGVDYGWDPAAKDLDDVDYVFSVERMREDEYRHLYRGDFDPTPPPYPGRLMVTTTPYGHEHSAFNNRFVEPLSEAERAQVEVLQGIVDKIAQQYWRRP
jgi:hypothetical protein